MAVKYNHRLVKLLTFKAKTDYLTSRPIKFIAFGLCMATCMSLSSVIHELYLHLLKWQIQPLNTCVTI